MRLKHGVGAGVVGVGARVAGVGTGEGTGVGAGEGALVGAPVGSGVGLVVGAGLGLCVTAVHECFGQPLRHASLHVLNMELERNLADSRAMMLSGTTVTCSPQPP